MKFDYAYRDSNNERHDGQLVAPSRDEAFKILRAQGLRPFFVAPSKGLLNRLQSYGKRGLAIAILSLISLLLVFYFLASIGLLGDAALKYFVDAEALRVKGILPPLSTSTSSLHLKRPPLSPSSLHLQNREQRELVSIVLWLRSEFSAYLANGNGTPETYLARLLERQTYEAQFYARAKRELEGVTDPPPSTRSATTSSAQSAPRQYPCPSSKRSEA